LHTLPTKALEKHLAAWGLDQPAAKRETLDKRWRAFAVHAKSAQDEARATGGFPDYAAVARNTLRVERNRGGAASCATLFAPRAGSGRAAGGAKSGEGAAQAHAAGDAFAALVCQIRARGQGGAGAKPAQLPPPPPPPPPEELPDADEDAQFCGTQAPRACADDGEEGEADGVGRADGRARSASPDDFAAEEDKPKRKRTSGGAAR
jgi:hypothetical protein